MNLLKSFTSCAKPWRNVTYGAQPRRVAGVFVKYAVLGAAVAVLWQSAGLAQVASFKPGVVKIMVLSPALKTGAGFVIARTPNVTYIVTAAHVVERADKISVQFLSPESAPVSARTRHVEAGNPQGMALLEVSGPVPADVQPLPLASESTFSGGESVTVIGHQASTGDWGVITGTVSSRKGREIVIQAPIEEQASGGPVFHDNRVLGLVVSTRGNFGYAITARAVQDYVEGFGVLAGRSTVTAEKPSPKPTAETRRIVINGPKPLYAPFTTGDVFQECANCPEMVVIVPDPNGFTIGTAESEAKWGRDNDEKPFGPIKFARPYAIGRFEITRGQFASSGIKPELCRFWTEKEWQLDSQRSWQAPGFEQDANHPVVCVSWNDAQGYLKWLNGQPGLAQKEAYRLPSEAEWEYAARGGTTTARYWGNEPDRACDYANVLDQTAKRKLGRISIHECDDGFVYTAPVGRYKPNGFGLYDMIGNVLEWVQDCYTEQYPESIRNGGAFERANCGRRALRGGSWDNGPRYARSANRSRDPPGFRYSISGFRVARTL
jgi:formylglycine-generating enzyme required for sulfatase activity